MSEHTIPAQPSSSLSCIDILDTGLHNITDTSVRDVVDTSVHPLSDRQILCVDIFKQTDRYRHHPIGIAFERLAPWTWHRGYNPYPGRIKLILSMLGGSYAWSTVFNWAKGKAKPSVFACLRFAEILEARAEGDLACAAELRRLAAEGANYVRQPRGFEIVKDRHGIMTDGRGCGAAKGTKRRKGAPDKA